MDVAAFSGDKFDPKEWINKTFKQPEALSNRDQFANSMVMKLQLMIAKLNSNLEDQSEAVYAHILPKLLLEVDALQHETASLQSQMEAAQKDIDQVSLETEASMQELVEMDRRKQRIHDIISALREADNWTTLSSEIEEAFDGANIALIAEKLTAIQNSLKILSHTQDYNDRFWCVEGFKNRLEALTSPQLVAAFNAADTEKSKFFVRIFSDMDRSAQLVKYYRKCVRAKYLKLWSQLVEEETGSETGTGADPSAVNSALPWVRTFFEAMVKHVNEQVIWFEEVFPGVNVVDNMLEVLLDVYSNLDPRMDFCIEAGLKQYPRQPLSFLIHLKQLFNAHLLQLVTAMRRNETVAATATSRCRELGKVLYQPFRQFVARYSQMERLQLQDDAVRIFSAAPSTDIIDELKNISSSVSRIVAVLEEGCRRCCSLTEGCCLPGLICAMEECLNRHYVDRFRALMRRLEKRKAASHSWTVLQQALTLNQVSGELLLQLEQLNTNMSNQFLNRTKLFLDASSTEEDPMQEAIQQHHLFLLDTDADRGELLQLYEKVKQGSPYAMVSGLLGIVSRLCEDLQAATFAILFHPVREQLCSVNSQAVVDKVWTSMSAGSGSHDIDMPDFSFSPQEFITRVGQYLMTLPQHLEPYMTHDNRALSRALQERVFPFCSTVSAVDTTGLDLQGDASMMTPADFLLSCVARATCHTFQEQVLMLPKLTANSTKQLYTDIGYLGDILEDLCHPLTDSLKSIVYLLKLPAKDFHAGSVSQPHKLVSSIRDIRSASLSLN